MLTEHDLLNIKKYNKIICVLVTSEYYFIIKDIRSFFIYYLKSKIYSEKYQSL